MTYNYNQQYHNWHTPTWAIANIYDTSIAKKMLQELGIKI